MIPRSKQEMPDSWSAYLWCHHINLFNGGSKVTQYKFHSILFPLNFYFCPIPMELKNERCNKFALTNWSKHLGWKMLLFFTVPLLNFTMETVLAVLNFIPLLNANVKSIYFDSKPTVNFYSLIEMTVNVNYKNLWTRRRFFFSPPFTLKHDWTFFRESFQDFN